MLSILVCHSYFLCFDEKQQKRAKPYPPLATLQVAAKLRKAGHDVDLFDAMLADGIDDFRSKLESVQPQVVVLYEDNYNYLSKMCLGRMRAACCEMIAIASADGARIIAGGSDATDAPDYYLSAGADAVLLGEAIATLVALIERVDNDVRIAVSELVKGVPDVAATTESCLTPTRATIPLPVSQLVERPAWDLVDIESYREVWQEAHGYLSLNMAASRGCSFRCNWCAKPIWGNRYLQRTPGDVAAEMLLLKREYGAEHIWFADDIFGFRSDWVKEFSQTLSESGGKIPFTIQQRADLVTPNMADALSYAGCQEVWIGAESGSQEILDAMNKGTDIQAILRARQLLGERDIRVGFFLMLGYLGEELDDILATRDLVERARPDDVGVSVAYPLPGTKFYNAVNSQLGEKKNWQQSNDLEMMFAGTYRSDFYRIVRDLLHEQVSNGPSPDLASRWEDLVDEEEQFRQSSQGLREIMLATGTAR